MCVDHYNIKKNPPLEGPKILVRFGRALALRTVTLQKTQPDVLPALRAGTATRYHVIHAFMAMTRAPTDLYGCYATGHFSASVLNGFASSFSRFLSSTHAKYCRFSPPSPSFHAVLYGPCSSGSLGQISPRLTINFKTEPHSGHSHCLLSSTAPSSVRHITYL